jgi:hypothetical protein
VRAACIVVSAVRNHRWDERIQECRCARDGVPSTHAEDESFFCRSLSLAGSMSLSLHCQLIDKANMSQASTTDGTRFHQRESACALLVFHQQHTHTHTHAHTHITTPHPQTRRLHAQIDMAHNRPGGRGGALQLLRGGAEHGQLRGQLGLVQSAQCTHMRCAPSVHVAAAG